LIANFPLDIGARDQKKNPFYQERHNRRDEPFFAWTGCPHW